MAEYAPPSGNALDYDLAGQGEYAPPSAGSLVFDLPNAGADGNNTVVSTPGQVQVAGVPPTSIAITVVSTPANISVAGVAPYAAPTFTTVVSTPANISVAGQAPTTQVAHSVPTVNVDVAGVPPTNSFGKIMSVGAAASVQVQGIAPSWSIRVKRAVESLYTIWHTTVENAVNTAVAGVAPSHVIRVRKAVESSYSLTITIFISKAWQIQYTSHVGFATESAYTLYGLLRVAKEAPYAIRSTNTIHKAFESSYSLRLNRAIESSYDLITNILVRQVVDGTYGLLGRIATAKEARYNLTSRVSKAFEARYAVRNLATVGKVIAGVYSLFGDTVIVQTNQPYITYQGRNIRIVDGDVSTSEGGYTWEGNFTLADIADYAQFRQDEPFVVNLYGEEYHFVVDGKELRRDAPASASFRLMGVSPSARFAEPRSPKKDYSWEDAVYALDAAEEATLNDVEWNTVNWLIPAYRLGFTDTTPLDIVQTLAVAVGAVVQSSREGVLQVRPLFPISVPAYAASFPAHTFLEGADILEVSENYSSGEIANKFRIADADIVMSDQIEWVPDSSGSLAGYIKAYPQPWRTDVNLIHTGDGTVVIGMGSVRAREEEELVEIFQGQGSLQYPLYQLVDVEWEAQNLGGIVFVQDAREFTVTGPGANSLVRVTYRTRSIDYRVVSGSGRPTQFLLESPPL